MCLSWCCGGDEEEDPNAQNQDQEETKKKKCCISWCAIFAAVISVWLGYLYKVKWDRI